MNIETKTFIDGKRVALIGKRFGTELYQEFDDTDDTPVWGKTIYVTNYTDIVAKIDISAGDNVNILDEYVVA